MVVVFITPIYNQFEEVRKASQIETDSNSSGYVIMVEKIQTDI